MTWTGDGSSSKAITGLQFQPDLVWIKERSSHKKSTVSISNGSATMAAVDLSVAVI